VEWNGTPSKYAGKPETIERLLKRDSMKTASLNHQPFSGAMFAGLTLGVKRSKVTQEEGS
jgi:hypothetical protein